MRRRQFLQATAILSAGSTTFLPCAGAASVTVAGGGRGDVLILADRLLQAYPLRWSLAAIGTVARQDLGIGSKTCPACLAEAMDQFMHHLDWPETRILRIEPAAIRTRITRQTTSDFEQGRILTVRGWLLAETELRLCSIAALRAT